MAHTFEMRDWRRLRGVKGLEATEPGAWAALHWAPPPFRVLGGGCYVPQALHRGLGGSWGLKGLGKQRPVKVHGGNRWREPSIHILSQSPAWKRSSEWDGQSPWTQD